MNPKASSNNIFCQIGYNDKIFLETKVDLSSLYICTILHKDMMYRAYVNGVRVYNIQIHFIYVHIQYTHLYICKYILKKP